MATFRVCSLIILVLIGTNSQVINQEKLQWIYLNVPKTGIERKIAFLHCSSNLLPEIPYTVKWYKDNNEFYSYTTNNEDPIQTFTVEGVTVDVVLSNDFIVFLRNLTLSSAGEYRCNITSKAPDPITLSEAKIMQIEPYDGKFWGDFAVDRLTSSITVGGDLKIRCDIEVGTGQLESIKWFKDNELFYSYTPKGQFVAAVKGVNLDISQTDKNKVVLRPLTVESSGEYLCEVRRPEGNGTRINRFGTHLNIL